jgi:paraquat-inducible protein A
MGALSRLFTETGKDLGRSIDASLSRALGTFLLLFPANLLPLLSVSVLRVYRSSQLASGILDLWNEQWVLRAILIGFLQLSCPLCVSG